MAQERKIKMAGWHVHPKVMVAAVGLWAGVVGEIRIMRFGVARP